MNNKSVKPAYKQDAHWLRVVYNIMFYVIYKIVDLVVLAVLIIQLVISTFADSPNQQLQDFGKALSLYVKQIVAFISFASDEKPYPFSDWPSKKRL
jgi:hypothetical protein